MSQKRAEVASPHFAKHKSSKSKAFVTNSSSDSESDNETVIPDILDIEDEDEFDDESSEEEASDDSNSDVTVENEP